ncbi:hypothetical protein DFH06DRAFT_1131347 [Mycena polygramma]|nr:hypothetical protein DFH06DRAFT_1131347 [Mycena polygramma]
MSTARESTRRPAAPPPLAPRARPVPPRSPRCMRISVGGGILLGDFCEEAREKSKPVRGICAKGVVQRGGLPEAQVEHKTPMLAVVAPDIGICSAGQWNSQKAAILSIRLADLEQSSSGKSDAEGVRVVVEPRRRRLVVKAAIGISLVNAGRRTQSSTGAQYAEAKTLHALGSESRELDSRMVKMRQYRIRILTDLCLGLTAEARETLQSLDESSGGILHDEAETLQRRGLDTLEVDSRMVRMWQDLVMERTGLESWWKRHREDLRELLSEVKDNHKPRIEASTRFSAVVTLGKLTISSGGLHYAETENLQPLVSETRELDSRMLKMGRYGVKHRARCLLAERSKEPSYG